jgi:hypothetical protein
MLTVTTTSTSAGLTTLDALKGHLGITTTDQDDLLSDAILGASDAVATYIGYYPLRQTYRETIAGFGNRTMMVSRTPLTAVSALYYGSTGLLADPASYVIDNTEAGFIVRDQGFPWSAGVEWDLDAHIAPRSERKIFIVDYTAGWVMSTGAGRTLPYDLEQAAVESAKSQYLGRKRDGSITSKSVGDLSVSYGTAGGEGTALPPEAIGFLQRYRRVK